MCETFAKSFAILLKEKLTDEATTVNDFERCVTETTELWNAVFQQEEVKEVQDSKSVEKIYKYFYATYIVPLRRIFFPSWINDRISFSKQNLHWLIKYWNLNHQDDEEYVDDTGFEDSHEDNLYEDAFWVGKLQENAIATASYHLGVGIHENEFKIKKKYNFMKYLLSDVLKLSSSHKGFAILTMSYDVILECKNEQEMKDSSLPRREKTHEARPITKEEFSSLSEAWKKPQFEVCPRPGFFQILKEKFSLRR
jgi:hypothetical protein